GASPRSGRRRGGGDSRLLGRPDRRLPRPPGAGTDALGQRDGPARRCLVTLAAGATAHAPGAEDRLPRTCGGLVPRQGVPPVGRIGQVPAAGAALLRESRSASAVGKPSTSCL